MGYKIEYGPPKKRYFSIRRGFGFLAVMAISVILGLRLIAPDAFSQLQQYFMNHVLGDAAVAIGELTEKLESGQEIGDAIIVFCQEVIFAS